VGPLGFTGATVRVRTGNPSRGGTAGLAAAAFVGGLPVAGFSASRGSLSASGSVFAFNASVAFSSTLRGTSVITTSGFQPQVSFASTGPQQSLLPQVIGGIAGGLTGFKAGSEASGGSLGAGIFGAIVGATVGAALPGSTASPGGQAAIVGATSFFIRSQAAVSSGRRADSGDVLQAGIDAFGARVGTSQGTKASSIIRPRGPLSLEKSEALETIGEEGVGEVVSRLTEALVNRFVDSD